MALLAGLLLMTGGCDKYDDAAVLDSISELSGRVTALETWQQNVNTNVSTLQAAVAALNDKDFVTSVESFTTPAPGGYKIYFSKNPTTPATIYNGTNGTNGDPGVSPQIGVRDSTDGKFYWTLNGSYILQGGDKLPVTGDDGLTPQLRIDQVNNVWEASYNGGTTWDPVVGGTNAVIFSAVDNSNAAYVELTLADDTKIQLPKRKVLITFTQPGNFQAGSSYTVPFTLASAATVVRLLDVPADWTVTLTKSGTGGSIAITAPAAWTATNWQVEAVILAFEDEEQVVMRALKLERLLDVTPPAAAPADARTSNIWRTVENGITYFWSDLIEPAACDKEDATDGCRSHTNPSNSLKFMYFNWNYVNTNGSLLCPAPWRLPVLADYKALDRSLGGTGANSQINTDPNIDLFDKYRDNWGGLHTGRFTSATAFTADTQLLLWINEISMGVGRYVYFSKQMVSLSGATAQTAHMMTVRCVLVVQ
jgi:uncharacterized protein (TIGR02145 family)